MLRGSLAVEGGSCLFLFVTMCAYVHLSGVVALARGSNGNPYCYTGFYANNPENASSWLDFETRAGYPHMFVMSFKTYWDTDGASAFVEKVFSLQRDEAQTKHIPIITFEGWGTSRAGPTGGQSGAPDPYGNMFPAFNKAVWTQTISRLVSVAEADPQGRPIFLRVAHEMNLPNYYEWGRQTPKEYRGFWVEMAGIVRSQDPQGRLKLVWAPALVPSVNASPAEVRVNYEGYYPWQNEYIDWIGIDVYSQSQLKAADGPWQASELLMLLRDFWAYFASERGKPLIITETASDIQEYKAEYATELFNMIAGSTENSFIKGVVWFDAKNELDDRYTIPAVAYKRALERWGVRPVNGSGHFLSEPLQDLLVTPNTTSTVREMFRLPYQDAVFLTIVVTVLSSVFFLARRPQHSENAGEPKPR